MVDVQSHSSYISFWLNPVDMASTGWWDNSSRSLAPDCITSSEFDINVDTAAHSHISSITISLTIPLTSDCISQMLATFEHSLVTQQPYHQILTACTRSGYNNHFCSAIHLHIISSFLHHSQWIWQLDTGSVMHSQITYIISSSSYITWRGYDTYVSSTQTVWSHTVSFWLHLLQCTWWVCWFYSGVKHELHG